MTGLMLYLVLNCTCGTMAIAQRHQISLPLHLWVPMKHKAQVSPRPFINSDPCCPHRGELLSETKMERCKQKYVLSAASQLSPNLQNPTAFCFPPAFLTPEH